MKHPETSEKAGDVSEAIVLALSPLYTETIVKIGLQVYKAPISGQFWQTLKCKVELAVSSLLRFILI